MRFGRGKEGVGGIAYRHRLQRCLFGRGELAHSYPLVVILRCALITTPTVLSPPPQHDGKWDHTQGETVNARDFDTFALKLPKNILKSGGHAWCVSALGERGGTLKLHTKKTEWKYGPPVFKTKTTTTAGM